MQPLVRSAAIRGATVAEVTRELRLAYGRAYRRTDLLADIRSYRSAVTVDPIANASAIAADAITSASAVATEALANATTVIATTAGVAASTAIETAISGYRDMRGLIARVGVAAFSISLLLPTLVHGDVRAAQVMVASSIDQPAVAFVEERIALPNARPARVVATPAPTPIPTPVATPPPTPQPPTYAALPNGMTGIVVTASWYGPGFYENRLPCWQWLQANGLPIQYLPDTWGVAHKTLPCGTMLTLSHGSNVITVPVVDRGPYIAGRELDLAPRVKAALGCTDLCTVVMHIP